MKTKYVSRAMLAVFLMLIALGCQRENFTDLASESELSQKARTKLSTELIHWETFQYDHDALYASIKDLPLGAEKYVDFPNPEGGEPLKMKLRRNDVIANDLVMMEHNGKTSTDGNGFGIRTFDGELSDGKIVSLTISPDLLGANIFYPDRIVKIESAKKYDWEETGKAVAFSDDDLKNPMPNLGCSEPLIAPGSVISPPQNGTQKVTQDCWQIAMMGQGDYAYYLQCGSDINVARFFMGAAINDASVIYRPINIHLVAKYLIQSTSSEGLSYDGNTLLSQVVWIDNSTYSGYDRDLTLYFTGKNVHNGGDYGLAGLAYVGVLCNSPTYSYGIAETINGSYNLRIQAHEIGHMMGANHDGACPGGLMYPYYNSGCASGSLSQTSKDEVNWHLWFNHGCTYMAAGC